MSNNREQAASRDLGSSLGSSTAAAIDQMIRWPFWFTGATMDLMLQGMERMTGQTNWTMGAGGGRGDGGTSVRSGGSSSMSASGSGSSGSAGGHTSTSQPLEQGQAQAQVSMSTGDDQDLGGEDLKYVLWSILFCKPGYEAVLEPLQSDIVSYSADGASYAAVKIARYLEKARNGRMDRPQIWNEKGYPEPSSASRRSEPANIVGGNTASSSQERGWRIPADDHKYIKFVYRVERRLPKEEPEVTRIERVTIERGVDTRTSSVA